MNDSAGADAIEGAPPRRVLVTGAQGFVGRALSSALARRGAEVTAITRHAGAVHGAARVCAVGDFTAVSDWRTWLRDIDAVVHLAAVTHDGTRGADGARFRAVNVEVTRALGAAAVASGIERFVYLSSIKANGESSSRRDGSIHAYCAADVPTPQDDYGRSKLGAEQALATLWPRDHGALTILRPPLVFGPGQKGNLERLLKMVARQWPLPLAAIDNQRSLIYVDNLVAAILCALQVSQAGVRCYTVADVTLSTTALVQALARGLDLPLQLFAVPGAVMGVLARMPLIGGKLRRLTDSLVVDARDIERELGWRPVVPFEAAIAATCDAWRASQP